LLILCKKNPENIQLGLGIPVRHETFTRGPWPAKEGSAISAHCVAELV
jgi:hypothetical protein